MMFRIEFENGESDFFAEITDSFEHVSKNGEIMDVLPLKELLSYDHGIRTPEELSYLVGSACAILTFGPVLSAIGAFEAGVVDYDEIMTNLGLDVRHDDVDYQQLVDWEAEMTSLATSAGLIVLDDGYAGMTWIYRPWIQE